jgi:hypothetical protein
MGARGTGAPGQTSGMSNSSPGGPPRDKANDPRRRIGNKEKAPLRRGFFRAAVRFGLIILMAGTLASSGDRLCKHLNLKRLLQFGRGFKGSRIIV